MAMPEMTKATLPLASTVLKRVVPTPTGLDVVFAGEQTPVHFSWFWLKDHGVDEDSLDPATLQRRVDTFSIAPDIAPSNVHISEDLAEIVINWPDAPSTLIPAQLLSGVEGRTAQDFELAAAAQRVLWGRDRPLLEVPTVHFEAVMAGSEGLRTWLDNIVVYGFSLVEEVPSTHAATRALAERIGRVQETIFGAMWPLSAELADHGDSAYSTQYLQPHTDASYYHDAPGLQLFNCLEFDGKGGESVQVDGFAIAQRIKAEDPEAYETLTQISVPGHYLEPGVHLRAERPPIRLNANGEICQLTFNNYDRAPFHLPEEAAARFYRAYAVLNQHVMDQANWLKIPLRPGSTLIFDNWRNLHGRMGYVGKRVFYGCYISNAEFESKLRVLQAAS